MSTGRFVLLVDDDPGLLRLLALRLESGGYRVATCASGEEALAHLAVERPRAVLTDLRMSGMDGMALFDEIHARDPALPVIILTAHGTIPDAVEATRRGVFGYLTKPVEARELTALLERAMALGAEAVPEEGAGDESWRAEMITASPRMEALLSEARLVAQSPASVLIRGESGTGKEVLARAVHRASPRREGPFVAVNCAAIPEPLLESELFGHAKGAFTGAVAAHRGLLQEASGGTLFLDEIGDMPLTLQAKLLRVLQEREVRPVGATRAVAVDVRVISATHRDLEAGIAEGSFREDLYYRLNVVHLALPPLRERREDIPLLARHFLARLGEGAGQRVNGFTPEAVEMLLSYDWPGNVRQLINVVEQCCALSTTPLVSAHLVSRALRDRPGEIPSFAEAKNRFERDYLVALLKLTRGQVAAAARLAGRNRTEFYRLLKRHQLSPDLFKGGD
ncbi:MAG: sigma 54-interacting transcriptional regulator [Gammaproteobacteria bacterium]|nr:sigma 54-interacting transcriptional regulator [Gammaproteobacteria bacterium]